MGRTKDEPHLDYSQLSQHQSQRASWPPRLIVIHATEGHNRPGVEDLKSLGGWFSNPDSRVSCHIATDAEGYSARYVQDDRKAWHCMNYNGQSLGIEQVGFTAQNEWPAAQLKETAKWVAYWSIQYGIPIRKARVLNGVVLLSGVARHSDLGNAGGNHGDPGKGYDMKRMFRYARWYKKHGWYR